MQNENENFLSSTDEMKKFQKKKQLMILKRKASSDCLKMLPLVRKDYENDLIHPIMGHLTTL